MWNYDLDIGTVLICLVLIVFYVRRRALPLRRNRLFFSLMIVVQLTALLDILASVSLIKSKYFSLGAMYSLNEAYFLLLTVGTVFYAFFCFSLLPAGRVKRMVWGISIQIPFLVFVGMILSNYWTGWIFEVSSDGDYRRGSMYFLIFVVDVFYLLLGFVFTFLNRKKFRRLFRVPVLICSSIVLGVHCIQYFALTYYMIISFGQTLGVLVLFLTFQNPDFYKDSSTMLFTPESKGVVRDNDAIYGIRRRVAMIAFENYEDIKNIYGAPVMRQAVQNIGTWMKATFPKSYCFYLHKGHFLLMSDPKNRKLERPFNKIRRYFEKPVIVNNTEIFMKPCFAHMMETNSEYTLEEFNAAMDMAIERALTLGNGAEVEVDDAICKEAVRDSKVNLALERAVKGKGLEVFYQPIYSTEAKRITSAEALVRIRDEELGLIFPDEFIWKAEANNSILILGQKIFEQVCRFIKENDLKRLGLEYIEVNLSPVQCMRQQLADEFKNTVKMYGIDPKTINLEITESGNTISDIIQKNMESLAEIGITFSLDDYGTGFSNLVNVLDMPLQIVKVDKSIVWAYFRQQNKMLTHVIKIFKDSRLKIVCEGVETLEMVEELSAMGCDYLQGYYFSKPIPADRFLKYIGEEMKAKK